MPAGGLYLSPEAGTAVNDQQPWVLIVAWILTTPIGLAVGWELHRRAEKAAERKAKRRAGEGNE